MRRANRSLRHQVSESNDQTLFLERSKTVNLPKKTSLPFFAYGLFKPRQLCYSRIKELVRETKEGTVGGRLKERDGMPLLVSNPNDTVRGHLIYFHAGKEDEAYNRIMEIEPEEVYRWDTIRVDDQVDANVLLGRKEGRGSFDIEHCEEWDGRSDPFFNQGLQEVEDILKANPHFKPDYKPLFRLHMAYSLLWSAIERYTGLKYHLGTKVNQKVYQIAGEKCFAASLKDNVKGKREVFSAADLGKCVLDPEDPERSIRYYYQVRSNAAHRGKAVHGDFQTLKSSLEELLAIFRDVLKSAFDD